jgi:hypothetical protein
MAYIAKRAAAGADLTHNHKCGCTVAKAFMQIWTGGFFTDRGHFVVAQNFLNFLHFR